MLLSDFFKKILKLFKVKISREYDLEEIVLKDLLKQTQHPVIFDVGAFIGEKTKYYKKVFPESEIYCFEPYPDSFQHLSKNLKKDAGVRLENVAITNEMGEAEFSVKTNFDQGNSLLQSSNEEFGKIARDILQENSRITVQITTLDDFLSQRNIPKIHLLKLDIQGAELLALKGAEQSIRNNKIDFIYLEAQFLKMYEAQPYFHEVCQFLYERNYRLYNFFGGHSLGYQLREVNALFYRKDLLE